jgi:lysophospholipase
MLEDELPIAYYPVIEQFCQKDGELISFRSKLDGLQISAIKFLKASCEVAIVISSGRTESYIKYKELAYDLYLKGYSVFIMDHRGQGLSGRILPGDGKKQTGYVRDFQDYVSDLRQFYADWVRPERYEKHVLLGHSMGGCIGALYIETYKRDFDAVVLSCPMLEPSLGFLPNGIAESILDWKEWIGREEEYAPGKQGYDEKETFSNKSLTHSEVRWNFVRQEFANKPDAKLGGPSVLWVKLAQEAGKTARKNASAVGVPVLLLQAGADTIVKPGGQLEFCEGLNQTHPHFCRLERIDGARHEIFIESDMYQAALTLTLEFIRKNVPQACRIREIINR